MIKIENLRINSLSSEIAVKVFTSTGETISKVLFYTNETYGDSTKAVDLTSLLSQTSEIEDFVITLSDVNLEAFAGVFFLEFTSTNNIVEACDSTPMLETGVVSNLTKYHLCILDLIKSIQIENCEIIIPNDCEGNPLNLCLIETLLEGLYTAIECLEFQLSSDISKNLDSLCQDPCNIKETPTSNFSGTYVFKEVGDCTISETIRY